MIKTFYIAEVEWDPELNGKVKTTYSLHCGDSYVDAMVQVIEDFSEDGILSIKLTPCSDSCGYGILISESLANAFTTSDPTEVRCLLKGE